MRIGISAYLWHEGEDYRSAGVSTYTAHLLQTLPVVRPDHAYVAFHGRDAPRHIDVESVKSILPTRVPAIRIAWEQSVLPIEALRQRIDLLHGTVNVIPRAIRKPSVVTLHDLSFLRFPQRFKRSKVAYLRLAVTRSVQRASHVIAVSATTRRDAIELLGIGDGRITVVPSGVDSRFRPMLPAETFAFRDSVFEGRPYILHVGTLEPRKNIDVLIKAFSILRARTRTPHVLALVGARGWMYESLFTLVAELGLQDDVRFIDFVGQDELPLWYNCADLFAYPSAYEGFGLPLLEAMACGLPSITSATSALEELGGDATVTTETGSEEALEAAMSSVVGNEPVLARMRELGLRRAEHFSWENTARSTVRVYDAVLADGAG